MAVTAACLSCGPAWGEPLKLSLVEAIRGAVERNLDIRAELFNPAQNEADIQRSRSIYETVLGVQTNFNDMAAPSLTGGTNDSHSVAFNSSLSQLLWTGATASLSFNNSYTSTNSSVTPGSYWQSGLGAAISQPLLRNAGKDSTELTINVSRLTKFASMERFSNRLLGLVAQVRTEYFKLYSLREDLEVRKVSLELARKILDETKARVKAGVLPAMEILNAEFGVVSREKDLIDAERAVSDQADVLRVLLQLQGREEITTSDLPERGEVTVSREEALKRAADRPDIREQKRNLEIAELQARVLSTRTMPDLALSASAGLGGLDRTYPRTLDRVTTFDNPYWSIGLNFSYPLGNGAAENDYRKSRLKAEQVALQVRSLEEGVSNEVTAAVRGVVTSFKQIEVADRGRAFAEERLRAFMRKSEVGLATTKDVLDVENDLAATKSSQIKAVVGYANALTRFWQSTGELLERSGVRFVEGDADRLYANTR